MHAILLFLKVSQQVILSILEYQEILTVFNMLLNTLAVILTVLIFPLLYVIEIRKLL